MEIEFDPDKDAINRIKHGLSLQLAQAMDLDFALIDQDTRRDYGEARFQAIAPIKGRLHVLIYMVRDGTVRAISLRKANERERERYDQNA